MGPPPTVSSAPLVPSKNALRTLRRLALSPSTMAIGAFSSACGIVALEYDARRRIRVAEQIVETKRVLRSVSNGTAADHLKNMFEAAERGEDFTMRTRHPRRKRKSRSFSTAVVEVDQEQHEEQESTRKSQGHTIDSQQISSSFLFTDAESISEPFFKDAHPQRKSAVEQIISATRQQHKVQSHTVYGRPRMQRSESSGQIPACIEKWIWSETKAPKLNQPKSENMGKSDTILETDEISTLPKRPSSQGLNLSDILERDRKVFDTPHLLEPPRSKDFSTDLSWTAIEQDHIRTSNGATPPWVADKRALRVRFLADEHVRGRIPSTKRLNPNPSHNLMPSSQAVLEHARLLLGDQYLEIDLFIQNGHHDGRPQSRYKAYRWFAVMRYYLQRSDVNDLTIAEGWLLRYRHHFPATICTDPTVMNIVLELFAEDSQSERAREILFPSMSGSMWQGFPKTDSCFLAIAYLQYFFQSCRDFEEQRAEMEKVFRAAMAADVDVTDELVIPLLQSLCNAGKAEQAEMFLNDLPDEYMITVTHKSLEVLAEGFASISNWDGVMATLEKLHFEGYSRSHSVWFQLLYARIIRQFTAENNAERCFNLAVFAIQHSGLIPGGRIARPVICAAMRDGRHELIAEWGRLVDKVYTRMELPFSTLRGALQFSEVCTEIGASCAEIASACQSMAHGARGDPFSKYFRAVVWDLVRRDLIYRLKLISGSQKTVPDQLHSMPTRSLILVAESICAKRPKFSSILPDDAKLQRELARQLTAIEDLNSIFGGGGTMSYLFGSDISRKKTEDYRFLRRPITPGQHNLRKREPAFPETVRKRVLPPYPDLLSELIDSYTRRRQHAQIVDHSLLKYVVQRLVDLGRNSEAMALLCTIYKSEAVQGLHGVPFDEDLFSTWLHIANQSESRHVGTEALWAIIDSSRHLEFSQEFRLLTLFTYVTEYRKKCGFGAVEWVYDDECGRELESLKNRLADIANKKRGFPPERTFPEWKRWEEATRERMGATMAATMVW